jgi:hypothetical protein
MLTRPRRFVHSPSGRSAASLREIYPLCSKAERALCADFFARYAAGSGTGDRTPFRGIRQEPALQHAAHIAGTDPGGATLAPRLLAAMDIAGEAHVAVSGGIDAWVLAALLAARGCRVRGWYLRSNVPGYCEWQQAREMAAALDIPCEEIRVRAEDFVEAAADFVAAAEAPVYNLHPISKLLLARGLARRGVSTVVTGDGADQAMRHEWDCDLLPLTAACFRAAGVRLLTPFLSERVIAWCARPYAAKAPVRELARQLGVPVVPKRPTYFPDVPLPSAPRAKLPGIDHACLAYTTGLLTASLEEHALCAASPG